jgi:hypothetical protein
MSEDPYDVLGVPRGADAAVLRAAYRQGARRFHPDAGPANPAEAARKFCRLTRAYHDAMRELDGRLSATPAASAPELAMLEVDWLLDGQQTSGDGLAPQCQLERPLAYARVNETLVFVISWAVALATGLAAMWSLTAAGLLETLGPSVGTGVLLAVAVAVYAAIVAAALGVLVLTRTTVRFVLQLHLRARRMLPWPSNRLADYSSTDDVSAGSRTLAPPSS